jgi:predicted nucleic acid-binding protein
MIRTVDASAIAALVFAEPEQAWVQTRTAQAQLIAPALIDFELGNICWKKLRQFPEDSQILLAAWQTWCASSFVATEPTDPEQTMRLAVTYNLTYYDASYLVLAQHRNTELISLDARLVRTAHRLGVNAPTRPSGHTTPRSRN